MAWLNLKLEVSLEFRTLREAQEAERDFRLMQWANYHLERRAAARVSSHVSTRPNLTARAETMRNAKARKHKQTFTLLAQARNSKRRAHRAEAKKGKVSRCPCPTSLPKSSKPSAKSARPRTPTEPPTKS